MADTFLQTLCTALGFSSLEAGEAEASFDELYSAILSRNFLQHLSEEKAREFKAYISQSENHTQEEIHEWLKQHAPLTDKECSDLIEETAAHSFSIFIEQLYESLPLEKQPKLKDFVLKMAQMQA